MTWNSRCAPPPRQLDFERAARLRDNISALKRALEKQAVVFGDGTDADVVAFADDELEAAVQVFHVRGGRVRGQRGWIVEKSSEPGDSGQEHLVEQFLTQFYGEQAELDGAADESTNPVPRQVLVPCLPTNSEEIANWLSGLRGSKVIAEGAAPRRQAGVGRDGETQCTAMRWRSTSSSVPATSPRDRLRCKVFRRHSGWPTRRCASNASTSAMSRAPTWWRHLVVFEDGLPRKSDYRHYAIRDAAGGGRSDDVASIAEVTRRRFLRHVSDIQDSSVLTAEGKSRKFAYPPNLFVVDGGAPQVNAAAAVLDELGVTDVAVIGLAKRLEEVWVPSEPDPVIMPRNSEGLYLLQRIRDEAHRFAITYHRSKRSKRMTASALDSVRGLGEHRRKALVTHFGSLARLKEATVDEITAVPGIGVATAKAVLEALGVPPDQSRVAPLSPASLRDSGAVSAAMGDDQSRASG